LITILLQGYAKSPQQLKDDVDYYIKLGFNVVVSSYKEFTSMLSIEGIINNDEGEGETIQDSFQGNNLGINKPKNYYVKFPKKFFVASGFNLNFQLCTTKRGLILIDELYPQTEYILKCRADMRLEDLDLHCKEWISKIKLDSTILTKKLVTLGPPGISKGKNWKVFDFWIFGTKEDINKYFSIPYASAIVAPESYLTTYLRNKTKEPWEVVREKYFYFTRKVPIFWHKYNGWLDNSDEKGYTGIYPKHIKNDRPTT
tara:strand:- start:3580 stop:4350 length:771 start_codon:yes stop_codon:yes gene_type:complete